MQFSFSDALRTLGPDAAVRLINGARTPASYLFSQILPDRQVPNYNIDSGSLTIRPVMAGLVGMDSPYPEMTAMDMRTFLERTAKVAIATRLPEIALRRIQDFMRERGMSGSGSNDAMVEEVLNFTNAMLIQPHLDTAEWLRGQALSTGGINWTFNSKQVLVDYGVPAGNKPAERTGTAAYDSSASVFWADNRIALELLRYNRVATIMHPTTFNAIISNTVNNLVVTANASGGGIGRYSVIKMDTQGGTRVQSPDFRDSVDIITYGLEAEVFDPANLNGPTKRLPFIAPGKVIHVGANTPTGYRVGAGAQEPINDFELGYFHIAPTVEGGGSPGRWARVFTPENEPWSLRGEAVANELPVLETPEKLVIMDTQIGGVS